MENSSYIQRCKDSSFVPKLTFFVFLSLILVLFFKSPSTTSSPSASQYTTSSSDLSRKSLKTSSWGGLASMLPVKIMTAPHQSDGCPPMLLLQCLRSHGSSIPRSTR
ncbi:hypothetical protein L2E82_10726 [Cichorium intybus]|uniref:Uncharacterized protein n=1 Tax=Cichorium intybus TaxID=13427 RepID=A0ACB9GCE3_CICIN|nr:hypothetical protein L2E82_10726 [Cichorium intybus]